MVGSFILAGCRIRMIRIKDILTSYEMVCAILRSAPSRLHFEFELHPVMKVV